MVHLYVLAFKRWSLISRIWPPLPGPAAGGDREIAQVSHTVARLAVELGFGHGAEGLPSFRCYVPECCRQCRHAGHPPVVTLLKELLARRRYACKTIPKMPKRGKASPRYLLKLQQEVDAMQQIGASFDAVYLRVSGTHATLLPLVPHL